MVKHSYTVTLDKELVEEAQGFLQDAGAKLSPVFNNLLEAWVDNQKRLKKQYSEEEEKEEEEEE